MKEYLKRVLSTFVFFSALIVLTAALRTLILHLSIWFKPQIKTVVYIGLILSTAIMLYIIFQKRWENKSLKAAYLDTRVANDYSFGKDFFAILKSKENMVHTLALLSIVFINSVRIALTTHRTIVSLFLQVKILLLLFTALNILVWRVSHRKWHKSHYA